MLTVYRHPTDITKVIAHYEFGDQAKTVASAEFVISELPVNKLDARNFIIAHLQQSEPLEVVYLEIDDIDEPHINQAQAKVDFSNLPNWADWTGQEAADALKNAILAGMTKAEARAAIDAQFAGVTTLAQLGAATVAVLKQLSDAVIDGRDVGHQNEARAIMYIRNIVID